jgi:hypothetical protein
MSPFRSDRRGPAAWYSVFSNLPGNCFVVPEFISPAINVSVPGLSGRAHRARPADFLSAFPTVPALPWHLRIPFACSVVY